MPVPPSLAQHENRKDDQKGEARGNQCGIGGSRIRSRGETEKKQRPKKESPRKYVSSHSCAPGKETLLSLLGCFASLRFLRRLLWLLGSGKFTAFLRGPAGLVHLTAAGNSQSVRRHVFRDCRTCGDVGAITNPDGRHQRGVAADEDFVPDRRRILVEAVVIAGNRTRADVAFRSDLRVAQVREVQIGRA